MSLCAGAVDKTGIENLKAARAAGVPTIDGYIFPCVAGPCNGLSNPADQVAATLVALDVAEFAIDTLWLDIENFEWPTNKTYNQLFIHAMVDEGLKLFQGTLGIYSG